MGKKKLKGNSAIDEHGSPGEVATRTDCVAVTDAQACGSEAASQAKRKHTLDGCNTTALEDEAKKKRCSADCTGSQLNHCCISVCIHSRSCRAVDRRYFRKQAEENTQSCCEG